MRIILLVFVVVLSLSACHENSEEKREINTIPNDTVLNFGKDRSTNMEMKYQKGDFLFEFISKDVWKSSFWINSSGTLTKMISYDNLFGNQVIYEYDQFNSLKSIRKYIKQLNGDYQLQDRIAFEDGIIDEKNSCFIKTEVLEVKEKTVTLEIEFVSGYEFVIGEVYFGDKINSLKQAKTLESKVMLNNPMKIELPRNKVVFNDSIIEYGLVIKRSIEGTINGSHTVITNPNAKTFDYFFKINKILR